MLRRILVTPQAIADLAREHAYIARGNPSRADNYLRRLWAFIDDAAGSHLDPSKALAGLPEPKRCLVFGARPHARVLIVIVTPAVLYIVRVIGHQETSTRLDLAVGVSTSEDFR